MCEPYHSVNQFEEPDDNGDNSCGGVSESRLRLGLGKLGEFIKKIGRYFHLSKLGSGHSESLEWARVNNIWVPDPIKYEVKWWDRTTVFDGRYKLFDEKEALATADRYARTVSIGSLSQLRNFLEISLEKTNTVKSYLSRFTENLLNATGRDLFRKQVKEFGLDASSKLNNLIKLVVGFTRKRKFLNCAWADDTQLWLPPEPKLILA